MRHRFFDTLRTSIGPDIDKHTLFEQVKKQIKD